MVTRNCSFLCLSSGRTQTLSRAFVVFPSDRAKEAGRLVGTGARILSRSSDLGTRISIRAAGTGVAVFTFWLEYSLNIPLFQWDILSGYILFVDPEDISFVWSRIQDRATCKLPSYER